LIPSLKKYEEDPNKPIRFVSWGTEKGSGSWFYDMVMEGMTPEEKQKDIDILSFFKVGDEGEDSIKPVYFYLDDSANSGQQVQQGVYAFRGLIRDAQATPKDIG